MKIKYEGGEAEYIAIKEVKPKKTIGYIYIPKKYIGRQCKIIIE